MSFAEGSLVPAIQIWHLIIVKYKIIREICQILPFMQISLPRDALL